MDQAADLAQVEGVDGLLVLGLKALAYVGIVDAWASFKVLWRNARGELGTRTSTLHAAGIAKLRKGWVYRA